MEEYFKSEGCRLIEKNGNRVTYVAQCGHEHTTQLCTFKHGSSRVCKNCMIQKMKESNFDYHVQEGESLLYISKILGNHFTIKRTNEGCLADFLIRPLCQNEDKWAQVQLKTTRNAIHGIYMFGMKRRYPNCIIICHCVSENRFWVFRDYEVPEKNIGISVNGKYARNEVLEQNLVDKFTEIYSNIQHIELESALVPSSPYQRTEHEYRMKRERFFPHVKFEYPDYQHRRYDFIVNGKRYQEKVASQNGGENSYHFHSEYTLGENDFYFVHIPNSDYFFCLPEQLLIENQKPSGRVTLNIKKHAAWYAPFMHNYTRVSFSF